MKKSAVTLIELLVAVAIILVLAGVAGLSMKNAIKRNDYSKMVAIIPKAISVETNKAFEEGEVKTITLNLDSKYIETEGGKKFLPENYTYSVRIIDRTDLDDTGTDSALYTDTPNVVEFPVDTDGKITTVEVDSVDSGYSYTSKLHPSIFVERDGESFCRIDIISSLYITPKIKVYKFSNSGWILDSTI
jgi:prepilin-type N-terminal cleavage/methylation domain-containing protein